MQPEPLFSPPLLSTTTTGVRGGHNNNNMVFGRSLSKGMGKKNKSLPTMRHADVSQSLANLSGLLGEEVTNRSLQSMGKVVMPRASSPARPPTPPPHRTQGHALQKRGAESSETDRLNRSEDVLHTMQTPQRPLHTQSTPRSSLDPKGRVTPVSSLSPSPSPSPSPEPRRGSGSRGTPVSSVGRSVQEASKVMQVSVECDGLVKTLTVPSGVIGDDVLRSVGAAFGVEKEGMGLSVRGGGEVGVLQQGGRYVLGAGQQPQRAQRGWEHTLYMVGVAGLLLAVLLTVVSMVVVDEASADTLHVLTHAPSPDADLPACWRTDEGELMVRATSTAGFPTDYPLELGYNQVPDLSAMKIHVSGKRVHLVYKKG